MNEIFISYKSEDRERARMFASALEQYGYSVWWDRKIPPGKRFDQVIQEQLEAAQCVLVLWSHTSVQSDWVLEEAAEGQRRNILVPALVDNVAIPLGFRRLQAANLTGWQGSTADPNFKLLLASIQSLVSAPQPAPQARQEQPADKPAPEAERPQTSRAAQQKTGSGCWPTGLRIASSLSLALGLVYMAANSCKNPDLVIFTLIIGVPLAAILLFKPKGGWRFLWILVLAVIYLLGMPYGFMHGGMVNSPIFGLSMGYECQRFPETDWIILGLLAFGIAADGVGYFLRRKNNAA